MEERKKKFLQNVADKLQSGSPECKRVLLGFDGFVDEVVHVLGKDMMQRIMTVQNTLQIMEI